jgi:hypothetical protein
MAQYFCNYESCDRFKLKYFEKIIVDRKMKISFLYKLIV